MAQQTEPQESFEALLDSNVKKINLTTKEREKANQWFSRLKLNDRQSVVELIKNIFGGCNLYAVGSTVRGAKNYNDIDLILWDNRFSNSRLLNILNYLADDFNISYLKPEMALPGACSYGPKEHEYRFALRPINRSGSPIDLLLSTYMTEGRSSVENGINVLKPITSKKYEELLNWLDVNEPQHAHVVVCRKE